SAEECRIDWQLIGQVRCKTSSFTVDDRGVDHLRVNSTSLIDPNVLRTNYHLVTDCRVFSITFPRLNNHTDHVTEIKITQKLIATRKPSCLNVESQSILFGNVVFQDHIRPWIDGNARIAAICIKGCIGSRYIRVEARIDVISPEEIVVAVLG